MAYPHGYAQLADMLRKGKYIAVSLARQPLVLLVVYVLYVKHDKVGVLQGFVYLLMVGRVIYPCGGVKAGVDTLALCKSEQLRKELGLRQRLAPCCGYSSRLQELLIGVILLHELLCRYLSAPGKVPCIGIVAVFTPQRTALKEYHKADSGSVYRSEALR